MPKFVEFIGGPFDGHQQDFTDWEEPLPNLLHVEISPNTFRSWKASR
jgi:hypothetical protein